MIVSSTGDGEFPDNAGTFHRFLMRSAKEKKDLSAVRFTLLGLGSTDYSSYMGAPNYLHKAFIALGA